MKLKCKHSIVLRLELTYQEAADLASYLATQPKILKSGFPQIGRGEADTIEQCLKYETRTTEIQLGARQHGG